MKNLLLFIVILIGSLPAFSQVIISGSVVNAKSKPLPSVSITLAGTYDGTITDSSGRFSFSTAEKGFHALEITALGYKPVTDSIHIRSEHITIDFSLKEELSELKAVMVISGSFAAARPKRAATVLNSLDVVHCGPMQILLLQYEHCPVPSR